MMIPSLLELGSDQQSVLGLPFYGCHVVTGAPGTGKTVAAVYRAWALATSGRTVTLLTRSNVLYQYLGQMAPYLTEDFDVTTYRRWLKQFWNAQFATDPPKIDDDGWSFDWGKMQRECILQQVTTVADLVIDEGQQLPLAFYQLCHIIGVDVTVVADESELIGDDQSTISEIHRMLAAEEDPIVLRGNYRSTREIALLALEFCLNAPDGSFVPTRVGRRPRISSRTSLKRLALEVSECFERYPKRSIGIICRTARLQREIQTEFTYLKLSKYTQAYIYDDCYRNVIDFASPAISIINTSSMKGVEFDSVFVPDLDAYTEDPTSVDARLRLFVLCTRARHDLRFAHLGSREPAILSNIPESLLARQID